MDFDYFRTALLERRKELLSIMESGKQGAATVELDQTRVGRLSRMDALQLQAMSQESMRRHELELGHIAKALARMDSGDYGFCTECDGEIAAGRLKIDPAGPLCVDCAQAKESG